MATTLKDIADRLNVSVVTVSKVLNDTGNISDATRSRVIEVAKELRYRPNTLARSMRTGKTGIIGFVYSSQGMGYAMPWDLLGGIQGVLNERNYNLMVGEIPSDKLEQRGHVSSLLRDWTADGLLIFNQLHLPEHISDLIDEEHVPVVWLNSKQKENAVYFDDYGGARAAVFHYAALGHRRIAYFDHSHPKPTVTHPEHYSQIDRMNGYLDAMRELALEPMVKMPDKEVHYIQRTELYKQWLSGDDRPTALITYGHESAIYFAALDLGISIPRDMSVISFNMDTPPQGKIRPSIIRQSYGQLSQLATRMLFERLASNGGSRPSIAVPMQLISQGSCAPPLRT